MNEMDSAAPWFSWNWFAPSVLKSFNWDQSWWLWLALLIPLFFILRWTIRYFSIKKLPVAIPSKNLKGNGSALLRFIPEALLSLVLLMLLLALARPQKTNEQVEQWTEGIDIVLVMDISLSMKIEDFKPTRLVAAKNVALEFVEGRMSDRIGIVVFSGEAFSLSPLTTDYDLLVSHINSIDFNMIETSGTAIGSALAVGTNRLRDSKSKSRVCILLSDGENNAGNIDPITAAELAKAFGIKVYTIAIGKEGRVPYGKDFFGNPHYIENTLDETTLRQIAQITKGDFYRVDNNQALEDVFAHIDRMEKAEIKETRYQNTMDYYPVYLKWGISLLLIWLLLKSTFMVHILHD